MAQLVSLPQKPKIVYQNYRVISLQPQVKYQYSEHYPNSDEVKDLYGFPTNAIVTMADVVEYLYNRPYKGKVIIDDTLKAAIDAYYEQYGVK